MNDDLLLIANGFLHVDGEPASGHAASAARAHLGTVLANMAAYGYAPSAAALKVLRQQGLEGLKQFWETTELSLQKLTGADRRMNDFVVYKNFPDEVLAMSDAGYWIRQISMYVGAPNQWFTQEAIERPMLDERLDLKVLDLADRDVLEGIATSLTRCPSRWTDQQREHAVYLSRRRKRDIDLGDFAFKENGIRLIADAVSQDRRVAIQDATDVLRLAAAMSGSDVSLREEVRFAKFTRTQRRFLLSLLEGVAHLDADLAARPSLFKRLLSLLHPGDFTVPRVSAAYDRLYRGELTTLNARIERLLFKRDRSVLGLLVQRPGEMARRLHELCSMFGPEAAEFFAGVAAQLPTGRLLQLRKYVETINARTLLIHPPRGKWSKAKYVPNEKAPLLRESAGALLLAIDGVLSARLAEALPQGVTVDPRVAKVKLQTNDQELAPYGRGTRFPIPEGVTFLRTSSYWRAKSASGHNIWYDNGWIFLTEDFKPAGAVCWNHPKVHGAAFSGDPTNTKDAEGRACQLIDLNLDDLQAQGVRYAIWNVLAYSRIKFSEADEVCAALQWGEDARAGGLFEPARAQMVFPLKGDALTKYIAYVDLQSRELVYMDADLGGAVSAAWANQARLVTRMPAFLEYLDSLPSLADLFRCAPQGGEVPVLYSDEEVELPRGRLAYVFQRRNAGNEPQHLDLATLLGAKIGRKIEMRRTLDARAERFDAAS